MSGQGTSGPSAASVTMATGADPAALTDEELAEIERRRMDSLACPGGRGRIVLDDVPRLIAALRASRAEVADLQFLLKCGLVVTFLGEVSLELRKLAAEWTPDALPDGAGFPLCATCDCPMVLEGETEVCRVCAKFDWLAH